MSTDTSDPGEAPPPLETITLTRSAESGLWVARDEDTGVASQGETRADALANLDEAVAGFHGEGDAPSDEDIEELGIDPANNEGGSLEESDLFE